MFGNDSIFQGSYTTRTYQKSTAAEHILVTMTTVGIDIRLMQQPIQQPMLHGWLS